MGILHSRRLRRLLQTDTGASLCQKNLLTLRIFEYSSRESCVSVSQFMLDKLVFRLATLAGNFTVWNMVSSPMDRCPAIKPSVEGTIRSIPFSVRLEQESMCQEQCSLIWNPQ